MGQCEGEGLVALPEEKQDTILELNPARGGPAPHCFVAGMGVNAVGGSRGVAAWEKGLATGEEASGRGLGGGNPGAHLAQTLVLAEVAGCRACNPEEELDGGSFHPDGPVMGRDGSAGGGGDDCEHWGGDGDCCCCCSDGGCRCCGRCGDDGGSDGLCGRADVSLEDCDGF